MTTILVVDDSSVDRRRAGGLLQKNSDWDVVFASDGVKALEQLEMHMPDVVLTDMQMPNMNGLELVNAVTGNYPLLPVILMTAQGSEEIAVEALQRGAASYVPKRRLNKDLVEIVHRVLSASTDQRGQSRLTTRIDRHEVALRLENDLSLFPAVVSYLQDALKEMRICTDAERLRIGVALEEALLNAYYHGNLEVSSELRETDHKAYYELARKRVQIDPYRDRQIFVETRVTPSESVYVVRDEGPGFDPGELPDPTDPANLDRPSGRGVLLMRTFMDDVQYNDSGNQVTMTKRRTPFDPEDSDDESDGGFNGVVNSSEYIDGDE